MSKSKWPVKLGKTLPYMVSIKDCCHQSEANKKTQPRAW